MQPNEVLHYKGRGVDTASIGRSEIFCLSETKWECDIWNIEWEHKNDNYTEHYLGLEILEFHSVFAHRAGSQNNSLCRFDMKSCQVSSRHRYRLLHEYRGSWFLYPREDNSLQANHFNQTLAMRKAERSYAQPQSPIDWYCQICPINSTSSI